MSQKLKGVQHLEVEAPLNTVQVKVCSKCKKEQLFSDFAKDSSRKDNLSVYCRRCNAERNKLLREASLEKYKARCLEYYYKNKEKELVRHKEYRDNNKDRQREWAKNWRLKNKERNKENARKYRENNRDKVRELEANWRQKNPEKSRARHSKWAKNNPDKCCARTAKRRAMLIRATPVWLTPEMLKDIQFFYRIRAEMEEPKKWNVDHIIPLKGRNVRGLHVPWNLRLLPASVNFRKSNKVEQS